VFHDRYDGKLSLIFISNAPQIVPERLCATVSDTVARTALPFVGAVSLPHFAAHASHTLPSNPVPDTCAFSPPALLSEEEDAQEPKFVFDSAISVPEAIADQLRAADLEHNLEETV
jgi:hypothetical protein